MHNYLTIITAIAFCLMVVAIFLRQNSLDKLRTHLEANNDFKQLGFFRIRKIIKSSSDPLTIELAKKCILYHYCYAFMIWGLVLVYLIEIIF